MSSSSSSSAAAPVQAKPVPPSSVDTSESLASPQHQPAQELSPHQRESKSEQAAETLLNVAAAAPYNHTESSSSADNDPDHAGTGRWTKAEDESLRLAVKQVGPRNWKRIASEFMAGTRDAVQCLHRWQKVLRPGLVKGPWGPEEDATIRRCMEQGITRWSEIAKQVPGRIGKQCRERWFNHLDPQIKTGEWTEEEDQRLIHGQRLLGNKWSQIAKMFLPGRPENAVKNRWNAATRRRLTMKPQPGTLAAALAAQQAAGGSAAAAASSAQALLQNAAAAGGADAAAAAAAALMPATAIDALTLAAASARPSAKKAKGKGGKSPRKGSKKAQEAAASSAMDTLQSLCAAALGGEGEKASPPTPRKTGPRSSSAKRGSKRIISETSSAASGDDTAAEPDPVRPGSAKRAKLAVSQEHAEPRIATRKSRAARPPPLSAGAAQVMSTATPVGGKQQQQQGGISPSKAQASSSSSAAAVSTADEK